MNAASVLPTTEPQTTLVASIPVSVIDPQTTLKALSELVFQGSELPQTTEMPLTTEEPHTTELPHTTDDPQTTEVGATLELPYTSETVPVCEL